MLEQLANEIRAGGTLEISELAARLGTSTQLTEAMLEHLQRSGMIQPYVSCGDGCQGCHLQDTCNKKRPGVVRLWQSRTDG